MIKRDQQNRPASRPIAFYAFLVFLPLISCSSRTAFDGQLAYEHVLAQCALGPRYAGTEASWATGDYIIAELRKLGCQVTIQQFDYRGVRLRNVVGRLAEGKGPIVILGAHYDTRRYADSDPEQPFAPVLGANDGASGVAVLLELARCLDRDVLHNEVWLAFFDAEDQGGIEAWPWSVGARYMAEHLDVQPSYVVVVDMVGDEDQQIYWEHNSDMSLQQHIWSIAARLGYQEVFVAEHKYSVMDDHIPFIERGIVAVDLIDLDYPYWHTIQDTPDKVSAQSLARVGQVLEELLENYHYVKEVRR